MRLFKGIMSTLMFLILLLILIPLIGILMMYSSDAQLPAEFTYPETEEGINWGEYLSEIDFENLTDLKIGEKEVNLFLQTYVEMGLPETDDLLVNYAYLDFKEEEIDFIAHADVRKFMDFPVKVRVMMNSEYVDGVETLSLDKAYLGKLRVPNFVIRYALEMSDVRSEYLDHRKLKVCIDIEEENPYSEMIVLKDIRIDEEAMHLEIGLSDFISDEFVKPSVEIVGDSIQSVYTHLEEEEKAAADVILSFVEENPTVDPNAIGISDATELFEAFTSLSPEVQGEVINDLEEQLDPEVIEQLKLWVLGYMKE